MGIKKTVLATMLVLGISTAGAIPAQADANETALNQLAVQMWMNQQQQQAQQGQFVTYSQLNNMSQAAAAEADYQRRNGSYNYQDQFGRSYGPYGYAQGSGGPVYGVYRNSTVYQNRNYGLQNRNYALQNRHYALQNQKKYHRHHNSINRAIRQIQSW